MKTLIKSSFILLACTALSTMQSCTKLDDPAYSVYTDENFPTTPEQAIALTGPVYVAAQKFFDVNYFDMQQTGTDEVIVPTRGGDWLDGGRWAAMHYHTWNASTDLMHNSWNWGFSAIASANRVLRLYEPLAETALKAKTLAEIKTMRAWYYYCMMDAFGNIPILDAFDVSGASPAQKTRAEVFQYIASELEENAPLLSTEANAQTYGRPTQGMAYTLLAKLYLNAQVYTGTAQWNKTVENCDKVIALNQYELETSANYFGMFAPTNGPATSKEPIFVVPFDAQKARGNLLFNKVLHYGHQTTYNLTTATWNGWTTTPKFFELFEADDIRSKQWLSGQQKNADGSNLVYNGVNVVLDPNYFPAFDVGGDETKGRLAGARNVKYAPDPLSVSNNANNDIIIFRYADVLLMKAEAILRGSTLGTMTNALDLMNDIRDRAFNNDASKRFTTLTLQNIYDERGRELVMEMTRRTDMIRFGTFDDPNLFKGQTDLNTEKLFPIPTSALGTNTNLDQNSGYPN